MIVLVYGSLEAIDDMINAILHNPATWARTRDGTHVTSSPINLVRFTRNFEPETSPTESELRPPRERCVRAPADGMRGSRNR